MTNKQKIKCLFGFHEWGGVYAIYGDDMLPPNKNNDIIPTMIYVRDCVNCGKHNTVIAPHYYNVDVSHDQYNSSDYYGK